MSLAFEFFPALMAARFSNIVNVTMKAFIAERGAIHDAPGTEAEFSEDDHLRSPFVD